MYLKYFKRLIDIIISLILMVVLSPVFILVFILLLFANYGSPLFIQYRPGKGSRIFSMIKFKTMNDKTGENGKLLPDKDRLTTLGRFVRSTSMDELPQLLNVLKGDMSLIGPRPLLVKYLPRYNAFQARRHEVRPGITGWTQVNGRNALSWQQKFNLDVYYVDNVSLKLDMLILLRTINNVFLRKGINSATSATMEEFLGDGHGKKSNGESR